MPRTVTISASYGAYGDKIARTLADRLDLPFLDRAIPAAATREFAATVSVSESVDEPAPRLWERIFMGFAHGTPIGPTPEVPEIETAEQFRTAQEVKLREVADTNGAVILGRAAMVVLAGRPDVLTVRLDGPVQARIAQVVSQGVGEDTAKRAQREVDRARDAYARVFFNARQDDPSLYHMVLDSTALSLETCVDIITRAAMDRLGDRG
jgi:cytidylate kinase